MATLEELMAEDGYLPQGIEVNATTRSVTVPASVGTVAIAQDKNVRTLAIKVPRECFGVDLAPYDFTVNYKRGDGIEGSQPVDVSEDEGHLDVLWKVCPHAVQEPGTVQFQLCATEHAADGLTVVNEWHSGIAEFDVGDVLEHSDVFEDETYLDWAHKVIADCEAATASAHEAVGMIDSKLEEACAAAEEEIAAAEEERAIAELGRAEAEALRAAQFADMEQRSRGWLRYICQPGEFDPDTRQPIISEPHAGTMYFVPSAIPTEQSMYQEWIWVSGDERWESFGEVELSITPASPDQLVAVLDGTDGGEGGGEVVNLTGWRSVVPRLKAMFAGIVHKHSGADLTDGTVTAAKLASGAVTQAKIADGSVSLAKCDSTLRDSVSHKLVTVGAVGSIGTLYRWGNIGIIEIYLLQKTSIAAWGNVSATLPGGIKTAVTARNRLTCEDKPGNELNARVADGTLYIENRTSAAVSMPTSGGYISGSVVFPIL
jgi:hypothetical protein